MSDDRKPYNVAEDGYTFGPYRNEHTARACAQSTDVTVWLSPTDIDEYGKSGPFPPER